MTEMVEKLARVLHGKLFATITDWRDEIGGWNDLPNDAKRAYRYTARAVLDELREPTEEMVERFGVHRFGMTENWRAMIDAAIGARFDRM